MTIDTTINVTEQNRPLGNYTWVAELRNGDTMRECVSDATRVPIDVLDAVWSNVKSLHLVPIVPGFAYIRIDVQPGERVRKVFTRTFDLNLDGGQQSERPVIDTFTLLSDKPVHHYVHGNGIIVVTTSDEP